jgi:hypothetical protein
MKKILKFALTVGGVLFLFSGCEWQSSGSGDTWDDSNSWANFSGMYKQSGGSLIVQGWATAPVSTNSSSSSSTTSVSGTTGTKKDELIGTGGSNNRSFSSTLSITPILANSVSVSDGVEQFHDDGAGNLTSARTGRGTVNYTSGSISVLFELAPADTRPVLATYSWSTTNSSASSSSSSAAAANPDNRVADQAIYSFYVSQQGNKLYVRDNNGVEYNGELGSVANTGGENSGHTSGYIIAQYNAIDADGNKIVGTFQGDYIAPEIPANASASTTVVPSGLLANRSMQGTYMHHNGVNNGDINAVAMDNMQVYINPYNPNTNGTNKTNNALL